MHIVYKELSAQDVSVHRCATMLPSRLQCPERASFALISPTDSGIPTEVCKHHFTVQQHLGEAVAGNTYEIIPFKTDTTDQYEYRPPQK